MLIVDGALRNSSSTNIFTSPSTTKLALSESTKNYAHTKDYVESKIQVVVEDGAT